jgi:hypothetical protein
MSNESNRTLPVNLLAPPGIWYAAGMNSDEAKQLESYVESITKHSMDSAYGRQPLPDQLGELTYGHPQIEELATLEKNWDGYGSDRPTDNVIEKATDVWNLVVGAFGRAPGMPEVTPGSSGLVAFTWKLNDPNRQLELWVNDTVLFSADWCLLQPDGTTLEGDLCVLDDLIPVLQQFLES